MSTALHPQSTHDVIQICSSDPIHPPSFLFFPYLLLSSSIKLEFEILRRKLLTPQNTSDTQPTLHALNDKPISQWSLCRHSAITLPPSIIRSTLTGGTIRSLTMRRIPRGILVRKTCDTEWASRLTSFFRIEISFTI